MKEDFKEPILKLFGIYVTGQVIETLFGIPSATFYLFIAVGGIFYFASFFK